MFFTNQTTKREKLNTTFNFLVRDVSFAKRLKLPQICLPNKMTEYCHLFLVFRMAKQLAVDKARAELSMVVQLREAEY